jgi:hypothetical protein
VRDVRLDEDGFAIVASVSDVSRPSIMGAIIDVQILAMHRVPIAHESIFRIQELIEARTVIGMHPDEEGGRTRCLCREDSGERKYAAESKNDAYEMPRFLRL